MSLRGKTLFITGASRGIGLAIAVRAARDGANVAIAAKTTEPHPKLPGTIYTAAKEIEHAGGKALPLQVDIRHEEQVLEAVKKTAETFGGIDICVNNASAINLTGTEALDMKRYDLMHGINTRGTFVTSKACIPYLKKAANPHVLNLSPRTTIATAAVQNLLGGDAMIKGSRKPDIMADAAYAIFNRPAKETTGNFFIDEDVLTQAGVTDFGHYAVDPTAKLFPDFFC
jgi:citronellol/citronellal dehydrogenase